MVNGDTSHETRFYSHESSRTEIFVLQHRNDTEAIHALIDRLVADPNATIYAPEDADRFSEIYTASQSRHREQAS